MCHINVPVREIFICAAASREVGGISIIVHECVCLCGCMREWVTLVLRTLLYCIIQSLETALKCSYNTNLSINEDMHKWKLFVHQSTHNTALLSMSTVYFAIVSHWCDIVIHLRWWLGFFSNLSENWHLILKLRNKSSWHFSALMVG